MIESVQYPIILPCLVFFGIAPLLFFVRRGVGSFCALSAPFLSAACMLYMPSEATWSWNYMGLTGVLFRADPISLAFGYLFHLAAFIGVLFSLYRYHAKQLAATLVYIGGALGAIFSGDLLSVFMFLEIMAVSSACLIWFGGRARSLASGNRYLIVQLLAGTLFLFGALLELHNSGDITVRHLDDLMTPGHMLIFIAIAIKTAFPLLHTWMIDSYPESSPEGAVLLNAFTSKVGIYLLVQFFLGTHILLAIGAIMACTAVIYAAIENELRRVLCYSTISQLGLMVCGVAIGTPLATNAVIAHLFADVMFKSLLFMVLGAVLFRTGQTRASELGGLYASMPITALLCVIGALSISAVPGFSGFVTESMVLSAVAADGTIGYWLALLFFTAVVLHYVGIRLPYLVFFRGRAAPPGGQEAPLAMLIAMILCAVISLLIGFAPDLLSFVLPFPMSYNAYTPSHILAQLQLLAFSALVFIWFRSRGWGLFEVRAIYLDADWLIRRLLPQCVHAITVRLEKAINKCSLQRSPVQATWPLSRKYQLLQEPLTIGQAVLIVLSWLLMISLISFLYT